MLQAFLYFSHLLVRSARDVFHYVPGLAVKVSAQAFNGAGVDVATIMNLFIRGLPHHTISFHRVAIYPSTLKNLHQFSITYRHNVTTFSG